MEMTRERLEEVLRCLVVNGCLGRHEEEQGYKDEILDAFQAQRELIEEAKRQVGEREIELMRLMAQLQTQAAALAAAQAEQSHEGNRYRELAQEIAPPGTPLATEGEISFGKLREVVEAALADVTKERDELSGRYADMMGRFKQLVKFYDDHVGTPCEQIRHQQGVQDLQQQLTSAQATIAELQSCQCDGCSESLEGDAYCLQCYERQRQRVDGLDERLGQLMADKDNQSRTIADMWQQLQQAQATIQRLTKERDLQKEVADNQTWHVRALTQRLATVEAALKAANEHNGVCVWDKGFPHTCHHPPACEAQQAIVNPDINNTLDVNNALKVRLATVEMALKAMVDAWNNRGESTSLHVWNTRMKEAMVTVTQALAPAPGGQSGEANKMVCVWTHDGGDGWETTCRESFNINEGMTPSECDIKFCCFCGKPLEELLASDDEPDTGAQPGGEG